ncbi:MAG: phenylalanine--tRNA ligase subunit beta, partial [Bacteroidetes bacterium]|nr:phenylalanine--tRNA ligase subunit beta [Bacteroidota bacterium]
PSNNEASVEVVVENVEACPRYSGLTISGIQIEESPKWLKNKLLSIDQQPINNVVDITNFVLHELGQPLHAFDIDEIKGQKVVVKMLKKDTRFITLDEVERKLTAEDLMICNAEEGMCIAGVFGGILSGVKESTTAIFLESAYFDPDHIRRTSTHHGLKTEAAQHFERGMDPSITIVALKRAAQMIKEITGGEISSDVIDVYPKEIEKVGVELSYANVDRLIGVVLDRTKIKDILTVLGISIEKEDDNGLSLLIPTFKYDVNREEDVIEEILRIYGYNNIPIPTQVRTSVVDKPEVDRNGIQDTISKLLVSNGFNEIMGLSISRSSYYGESAEIVKLMNFSNADLDIMRPGMLYGSLEMVSYNQNRQNNEIRTFEFGYTYSKKGNKYNEREHLVFLITGANSKESWIEKPKQSDFFYLKKYVNLVLQRMGISDLDVSESEYEEMNQGMSYLKGKKELVSFGSVPASLLKKFGIKNQVYYADFDWAAVLNSRSTAFQFKELPKFPSVRRDLALILDKGVKYLDIEKLALQTAKKLLKEVIVFDIFEDEEKIGKNKKQYAIGLTFQDEKKTLTDKEVDKIVSKLISGYKSQLNASIR